MSAPAASLAAHRARVATRVTAEDEPAAVSLWHAWRRATVKSQFSTQLSSILHDVSRDEEALEADSARHKVGDTLG
jgi:hypothetical protein